MIASNSIRWLLDDCCIYEPSATGSLRLNITELAGNLAYHAMMLEAHLTPKPGLVDCVSTGAHRDMDINTFIASSDALRPYMKRFVRAGIEAQDLEAHDLLLPLRKVGIEAECAMFSATQDVNTHKGMIFTLGLICGAVGWLYARNESFDAQQVQRVIKACCSNLVSADLDKAGSTAITAGEKIYQKYGLTGIRGEAADGYPTIFNHGLHVYEECMSKGYSEEQAMSKTLLSLMAYNCDTNLINRGGIEGLKYVQDSASLLYLGFESNMSDYGTQLGQLDIELIQKNLSPGGSADLLAATWLLAQLNICSK
ncbi:triphosphoribosyl-dephospho-CoA synthase CitG [Vibrio hannami]|uniref:triphosphoribosyl-dephospho-CoA synthase CitG n=1 Tax=Vibrio hannami TaxID=2717094 RepID=UPI00240F2DD1|nr:triphosphoribosyl-dephospho-CoA synthase CitG [Vibrio hannami]MDG3085603.1 triphosphoribosyl-dephospho-CoA synthase CitG [Vibrio hannami]